MRMHTLAAFAAFAFAAASASATPPSSAPQADAVKLQTSTVPYSSFASPASRAVFRRMLEQGRHAPPLDGPIQASRAYYAKINRARAQDMRQRWSVRIERTKLGGVPVQIVTPAQGVAPVQRHRVLVNLHGGAFLWGAQYGGLVESIPLAGVGGFRVVSVDYRQGPEHVFPAASKDVEAVYRALLKRYKAADIGIYGCSAGGVLTAEATARILVHKLPAPGAIGTYCGSLTDLGGDSAYLAPMLSGGDPVTHPLKLIDLPYFRGAQADDPLAFPADDPKLIARFPPTLLITGTRDFTMSSMVYSANLLEREGVDAELHIWNGMWHAFFSDADMPESQQAYAVMVRFFNRHLGH
ncbi:alpha/beta hydrolase [Oleiagrimonas soli]|uniref:Acetyl esterase/lipase n=1 Tax=Oleiagrimonas soli TaxID=1543381 RepID=A0A099CTX4_9GAMM|nr:alpha/beta hydrolase fold domain-containing protein [Oleiagrimonas soli]KGI77037.1 alpha/beta hydrolase [Oleiagrimonas soli]MBB6185441.1 acetyl esterase/lipase [Oleiagrimonas soli]